MDNEFGIAMVNLVTQQIRLTTEVKTLIEQNKDLLRSAEIDGWLQQVESFEAKAATLFIDLPRT